VYIIGDFNLDIFKLHVDSDYVNDFVTQMYTSSFFPLITRPTRITDKTAISDLSDHLPSYKKQKQKHQQRNVYELLMQKHK